VLQRAGGLTDLADAKGSIFLRTELKAREQEQIATLANRMESDLASMQLSDPELAETYSIGQSLVARLRNTEPVGRMVINLQNVLDGVETSDVVLQAGDRLMVPQQTQAVTVIGEVQYAASHLFDPALERDDYIEHSGGMTARADKKRIYVVRVDGSVSIDDGGRWFNRRAGIEIEPGDTIVVPLETNKIRPLALWTGVTQTIYNMAIAIAAINSF
jgi:protein involved in polysaccharide export with SLBB domain